MERARRGSGSVVAVLGEAGMGKTSLLDELARRVCDDMRVLHAGCEALFTPRPLGPLYDLAPELDVDPDAPREALAEKRLGISDWRSGVGGPNR